ncbi:hypothetical protein QBL02_13010 [Leucobacter sp. UT-8R-CII-1-4]|uniref:hypothetical protein n=1 Tax=Leucobacter sp. UT-8R-CII-1-4 TaxID=3040075 RepID=UPI0024A7ECB0|nr:hypothetical protein [Leucobacter sp. UT-8R-CII-1-4]MDI6024460.1 hypothetical protein [Leucobacter sp. UT-8R-CII-1-4]
MIRHELRMPHPFQQSRFVVWDLTDGICRIENAAGVTVETTAGATVLDRGIEGMGHPKAEVFASETPRSPGRRRTGTKAVERSAFLPVVINARGAEWTTIQGFLWSCLSPDREAFWRVHAPDGSWRELAVFLDPSDSVYRLDPTEFASALGIGLVADDPFWLGPEQVAATAAEPSGALFFGNGAPSFNISAGSQDGSTALTVAGDVDVWPVLTVQGPASGFRVAPLFDPGEVTGAVNVSAAQKLVIDFDPRSQAAMLRASSATSGGTNVTAQLATRKFFPVAANVSTQSMVVLLSMIGAGRATLTYRPRYWRAI